MANYLETKDPSFKIRFAEKEDAPLILNFIKALAVYEKMEDEVIATEEILYDSIFVKNQAEVVFGEQNGQAVAFAVYFHSFSTFQGKACMYLEDVFVLPEARGNGYGKLMLACIAKIATDRGCGRMDWCCLDWNTSSIAFYKRMGAIPMDEWTIYRLTGDALPALAGELA